MSVSQRLALVVSLLCAQAVSAQSAVVLELGNDSGGRLRGQIEGAVERAGAVSVVPLSAYKEEASKKKLSAKAMSSPAGVARVAKRVVFDVAVTGEVMNDSVRVVMLDRNGEQLWERTLKLDKKKRLSSDYAKRLAKAVTAAVVQARGSAPAVAVAPPPASEESAAVELSGPAPAASKPADSAPMMPELDLSSPPAGAQAPSSASAAASEQEEELDPDRPIRRVAVRPKYFRAWLGPLATWRFQCLRPGVQRCSEYVEREPRPLGVIVDFRSTAPYLGFFGGAEVFPLAGLDNVFLQGLGLLASMQWGSSVTTIEERSNQGAGTPKEVRSSDFAWNVQATVRFHFAMGDRKNPNLGWVGVRGGLASRVFEVDPSAQVPLPSSQRYAHPGLGLDLSIPFSKYFRIEAGANLLLLAKPSAEQIIGYGNLNDPTGGVRSFGFGFEGGVAGELWGPLGWQFKVRYAGYVDQYSGQGQKWTVCTNDQCGGVAEEHFVSTQLGVTVGF